MIILITDGVHTRVINLQAVITTNTNYSIQSIYVQVHGGGLMHWSRFGLINWATPPPRLIPEVIRKIENEKCRYTLVCPEWRSAPYWAEKDGMF